MPDRPRVFLADDHAMLIDAFVRLLSETCEIVGTAADGRELLKQSPAAKPEIIITDVSMPGLNGLDAARQLHTLLPETRVIFLTQNDDPDIAATALADGAAGYLLKECAATELLAAIDAVRHGRTYLTPILAEGVLQASRRVATDRPKLTDRQREILQLVAEGHTMGRIGEMLHIAPRTVAHHKYKIMELVGAESTADLVRLAIREGLITE